MTSIYIIGSSNTDMVVKSDRLPGPGETVLGGNFFMTDGGKGANQAVAAARLGGNVTFVANVGNDLFGKQSVAHFQQEKINTSFISFDPTFPSGVALINVNREGENCITVASGSNGNLRIPQVEKALRGIAPSSLILVQLEIPLDTMMWVLKESSGKGLRVILNPAPAQPLLPEVYKDLYLITPNEREAEILTGIAVTDTTSAEKAARQFADWGVLHVVITLGSKGALLHSKGINTLIPAPQVDAMDSTGAGDCFNGALAVGLAENLSIEDAVAFAVKAASLSVTRMGAQASMPTRKEMVN